MRHRGGLRIFPDDLLRASGRRCAHAPEGVLSKCFCRGHCSRFPGHFREEGDTGGKKGIQQLYQTRLRQGYPVSLYLRDIRHDREFLCGGSPGHRGCKYAEQDVALLCDPALHPDPEGETLQAGLGQCADRILRCDPGHPPGRKPCFGTRTAGTLWRFRGGDGLCICPVPGKKGREDSGDRPLLFTVLLHGHASAADLCISSHVRIPVALPLPGGDFRSPRTVRDHYRIQICTGKGDIGF